MEKTLFGHVVGVLLGIIIGLGIVMVATPAKAGNTLVMRNTSNTIINQISTHTYTVITNITQGSVSDFIRTRFRR